MQPRGKIYLLNDGSGLTPMSEQSYDSEDLLQRLLAEYPDLLAGDQIDSTEPRRWLLVSREMSVPDEEDGAGRWSLDHLFLDQDAVPTLVEVKRSPDSRLRREVVGQMLDYASNAAVHWPVESIRAAFESRCEREGRDPSEVLSEFLSEESDSSEYWARVKTNLQARRIRMVFVADSIPSELRRIVEFLNELTDPAEVLAVEIRQFVGEGVRTLVPTVIGQSESTRHKKQGHGGSTNYRTPITDEEFLRDVEEHSTPDALGTIRRLVEWARSAGLVCSFTRRKNGSTFTPFLPLGKKKLYALSIWNEGTIWLQMRWVKFYPPFDQDAKRKELYFKMRDIGGFTLSESGMDGFPQLQAAKLAPAEQLEKFIVTLNWLVEQCRERHDPGSFSSSG